jgi:ZIP family zinc transporter
LLRNSLSVALRASKSVPSFGPPTAPAVLAFGVAALLYLVTEELPVETHGVRDNTVTTATLFVGFLVLLMVDVLT